MTLSTHVCSCTVSYRQPEPVAPQLPAKPRDEPPAIPAAFDASERSFGEFFDTSSHAAVIKMMMMTLGQTPADLFDGVTAEGDGYRIKMKDEYEVTVSAQELKQVARASRFKGGDQHAVETANVVLAAFVKRKQQRGGFASFDAALAKTLQGETVLNCLKGMGVYGISRYVAPSQLVGDGVVGVQSTSTFGSGLVLNGIRHSHGDQRKIDQRYGYRLFPSTPRSRLRPQTPQVPVKPKDIWHGFYQGREGNCVTVSAIKAAMMRFGQHPDTIYKQVTAVSNGFDVVMRDGFTLHLTHAELQKATQASHLRGSDRSLLEAANFLYAVSAKRAHMENNDFRGGESFDKAIETLNDGEIPGQALRRLGLYGYIRASDVKELANGAIGTLADGGHSVAVIDGALDFYGQKQSLVSSRWMNPSMWALKLA